MENEYKPMEALPFTFIPIHKVSVQVHLFGIKRKMRFLHHPVFSRIDRGKNTEILDWARKNGNKFCENQSFMGIRG